MDNDDLPASDTFCDVSPADMAEFAEYCDARDADFIECLEYLYFANAVWTDNDPQPIS